MSYDAKRTENEWFAQHEQDLIRDLKRERQRREQQMAEHLKKEEMQKQKELHWMRCPKCGSGLYQRKLRDIAIDVCQICDGMHFDRNELEDLLLKAQHERREIISWILPFPEDVPESSAEAIIRSLEELWHHKEEELGWLLKQGEALKRKELHAMKCPKCGSDLKTDTVLSVSAHSCPVCFGLFIDRIELQKLILKQSEERKSILLRVLKAFAGH